MLWAVQIQCRLRDISTLCMSTASVLCRRWNDPLHRSWQGIYLWPVSIWLSCRNNLWGISVCYVWSFIIIILKLIFYTLQTALSTSNLEGSADSSWNLVSLLHGNSLLYPRKVRYSCTFNVKQNLPTHCGFIVGWAQVNS